MSARKSLGTTLHRLVRDIRHQVHEVLDIVYTQDSQVASLRESARKNTDRLEKVVEQAQERWKRHRAGRDL